MEIKETIVELENISKIFNKKDWAIKKINLKLFKGEGVGIIGPNQSGKSVLGRLIANQIKQTGGIIEYHFNYGDAYSSIGFQFRQSNWPEGFKVKDIFNLYKNIYDIQDQAWIGQLIELFDIEPRWNKTLNSCSKSWLQLFSLFLAIFHKPELIIIDEVTSIIGIDLKIKILSFLKQYQEEQNATFIIISPDSATFNYLCQRVIVLSSGLIVSDDYKTSFESQADFENYSLKIIQALEQKEIELEPDPMFKPILYKFEQKYEKLIDHYNTFIEKTIEFEHDNDLNLIKNLNHYASDLHGQLIELSSKELSKQSIEKVKISIEHYLKLFKQTKRKSIKLDNKLKYKKQILQFLKNINTFINYLQNDLYITFKSNKKIALQTEKTAKLSKKELEQLNILKRRYIQEELKYLRNENRIIKRQQKNKK